MLGAQAGAEGRSWMGGVNPKASQQFGAWGNKPPTGRPSGDIAVWGSPAAAQSALGGQSLKQYGPNSWGAANVSAPLLGGSSASPYAQMSPKQQWRMGQAQSIQAPSQGTPYGQPFSQSGLREPADQTNPRAPSFTPNPQPAQRRMAADITPQAMAMGRPDNGGMPFQMPGGLRAWTDPTNPRGPNYNPSAVPSQPFGYGAGYFY